MNEPKFFKVYEESLSLGIENAVILSDIINIHIRYSKGKLLDKDGFFNYPRENVIKRFKISKDKQHRILKFLSDNKFIEIKYRKSPNNRLIKLTKTNFMMSQNLLDNKNISISTQSHDCELITFFNSLGNLKKHNRIFRGNLSKTYKRCEKWLNYLKDRSLYRKYKIDANFLKMHNIPNPIGKKFTDKEIMRGFRHLSLLADEDYGYVTKNNVWPSEEFKNRLKKYSIDQLLFNRMTNKSLFLLALYNKPKKLSDQLRVPFEEKYLNIFIPILPPDVDLSIKQRLVYTIDSIIKVQDYLIDSNKINWNGMSLGYKGDPENFLKKYFWFVKDELGIDGVKNKLSFLRNSIRSKNFWNSFCDFLKNEFFLKNIEEAKKMFK